MPPRKNSRYEKCFGIEDEDGNLYLTERDPFLYDKDLPGTKKHTVVKGDTLNNLAYEYFKPIPNAEHLWWIIAEFQPTPILDPTIDLVDGTILYIPSPSVVRRKVFGH